jgi:hypothetical protein
MRWKAGGTNIESESARIRSGSAKAAPRRALIAAIGRVRPQRQAEGQAVGQAEGLAEGEASPAAGAGRRGTGAEGRASKTIGSVCATIRQIERYLMEAAVRLSRIDSATRKDLAAHRQGRKIGTAPNSTGGILSRAPPLPAEATEPALRVDWAQLVALAPRLEWSRVASVWLVRHRDDGRMVPAEIAAVSDPADACRPGAGNIGRGTCQCPRFAGLG